MLLSVSKLPCHIISCKGIIKHPSIFICLHKLQVIKFVWLQVRWLLHLWALVTHWKVIFYRKHHLWENDLSADFMYDISKHICS